jgi:hypothetical protein
VYFVQFWVFNRSCAYRDKKVVGVFVRFFRAPLQPSPSTAPGSSYVTTGTWGSDRVIIKWKNRFLNSGITRSYHWIGYQNYGKTAISVEYDAMTIRNPC